VHESKDQIQVYIACGNIGGNPTNGDLVIGLEERSNSGYTGIAVLHPREDTVVVTVYLSEGLAGEAESPEATKAPAAPTNAPAASPAGVSVDIQNFPFGPAELDIKAGTTVTWTNQDAAAHTVTADDGSFDSGQLSTGQTFQQEFDTPGTFTYHCSNHP